MSVAALPDLKVLPADALRALILAQHTQLIVKDEQLQSREREIEHLQLLLAKLHRMQFGRKSEMLEYVPASFVVIRHVRTKLSCTKCDCIVQAEAPSRPIERGVAGPGLLAHVLVS